MTEVGFRRQNYADFIVAPPILGGRLPMNPITREFRIAFSKRVQPIWLRVIKWTVLIGVAVLLRSTPVSRP